MDSMEACGIQVYARVRPALVKSVTNDGDAQVLAPTNKSNFTTPAKSRQVKPKPQDSTMKTPSVASSKLSFGGMRISPQEGSLGLPTGIHFDVSEVNGLDETLYAGNKESSFDMDAVFSMNTDQKTVFDIVGIQHVQSVIDGYNSTIFAYGRTCSGKTHTIVGPTSQRYGASWSFQELEAEAADSTAPPSALGLVPRCIHALLTRIREQSAERHFTLRFACAEIYNQKLFDLCSSSAEAGQRSEVRDGKMTTSAADRISWHEVDLKGGTEEDAMARAQSLISRANSARIHASTSANVDSSRSHVLYLCRVASVGPEGDCKESMLSIVDLAGSEALDPQREKAAPGSASASRESETRAINVSLHTLTRVVQAYASVPVGGKPVHVPYRESLLTLLLKDSIGGNCVTSIIVTLSGDEEQLVHSYKSCQFARLARGVRNSVRENKTYDPGNVIASLRAKVGELQEAIASRDAAVAAESVLGPRVGTLLGLAPAPSYPTDRLGDVVAEWMDTAPTEDDGENASVAPEDAGAAFGSRVNALAALSTALSTYVKATGIPTSLDAPDSYEMGVGTSPALARGVSRDTAVGASVAGTSPTLLRRQDMSSAVDPSTIRSLVLNRMVNDTETWLTRAKGVLMPMLACAAGVLDRRMTSLSVVRGAAMAQSHLESLPRLTISTADDDPAVGAQRDYARTHARMDLLAQEIQSAEGRLEAMKALLCDTGTKTAPILALGPSSLCAECPSHLPASASFEWQVKIGGKGGWTALPDAVGVALQDAYETARGTVIVADVSGSMLSLPASQTPSLPTLPDTCAGGVEAVMDAGDALSLSTAAFPATAAIPFTGNVVYNVASSPGTLGTGTGGARGTQRCVLTGCTRAVRRVVFIVCQGDLAKKSKWGGGWVSRTMRLTPGGFLQVGDASARKEARGLVRDKLGPGASASTLRAALARCGVTKIKAQFMYGSEAGDAVTAEHTPNSDNEGRLFIVHSKPSTPTTSRPWSQQFMASSAQEALTWVAALNAAAAGMFRQCENVERDLGGVQCEEITIRHPPSSVATLLDGVTSARLKEARTRSTRLSFDSDALAVLATPLVPPARSLGLVCKELGLSWSPGLGEGPCGTPVLVPASLDGVEGVGMEEAVERDLAGEKGWATTAALLGVKRFSTNSKCSARIRRILRVQNAVLAQRFLGLCAEHRYRNGRKALASGLAFATPDANVELDRLLLTGSADDALASHLAPTLTAAFAAQVNRVHAMCAAAGAVPGAGTMEASKTVMPVLVFRVAYATAASMGKGTVGNAQATPIKALSRVLSSADGSFGSVAPPPLPPASITSVADALARPDCVVALYPAYVLLLSIVEEAV